MRTKNIPGIEPSPGVEGGSLLLKPRPPPKIAQDSILLEWCSTTKRSCVLNGIYLIK
ncbi:hypothetical protein L9F63_025602, partial [Diploptera punctata]